MIIEMNDKLTIADVQDTFSSIFPFLKIEFFEQPYHWYGESRTKAAYPDTIMLCEIKNQYPHGRLEFPSWYSSSEVEQDFRKKCNLHVKVFRLRGNSWIHTMSTDKLFSIN